MVEYGILILQPNWLVQLGIGFGVGLSVGGSIGVCVCFRECFRLRFSLGVLVRAGVSSQRMLASVVIRLSITSSVGLGQFLSTVYSV